MIPPPPSSTLFPYTTLFRSAFAGGEAISLQHNGPSELGSSNDGERRIERFARCRSEEHTSELQSRENLVCRLLLEKKNAQRSTPPALQLSAGHHVEYVPPLA